MFGIDDNLLIGAGAGIAVGGIAGYFIGRKTATKQPKLSDIEKQRATVANKLLDKIMENPEAFGLTKDDLGIEEKKEDKKNEDKPSEEKKD